MKMRNVTLLKTVNTNGMISLVDDDHDSWEKISD